MAGSPDSAAVSGEGCTCLSAAAAGHSSEPAAAASEEVAVAAASRPGFHRKRAMKLGAQALTAASEVVDPNIGRLSCCLVSITAAAAD